VNRFSLYNRYIIENAPLQVYTLALIFSPVISRIRLLFQNERPSWISWGPPPEENWSLCLQTLEGCTDMVRSAVFSHDSWRLASSSSDKTVRIWDAKTRALQQELKGNTSTVTLVVFSYDGRRLASSLGDKKIQIWNANTGALRQELKGHTGWVSSVAFSHDGRRLASRSSDEALRILDVKTGALQQKLTATHDIQSCQ
jgi:WD40 repeat protein